MKPGRRAACGGRAELPRVLALGLVLATIATACSSSSGGSAGDPLAFELDAHVDAFGEAWRCRLVQMPHVDGGGKTFVTGGVSDLSAGTHHALVYRTTLTSIPAGLGGVVDCAEGLDVMQYARGWVTGSQVAHESQDFPPGVALPFASDEVLLVQGHFLNATSAAVDAHVRVAFHAAAAADVRQEAGILQFYDPYIDVPAHAAGVATMRCPIAHDITLLSAGSHMHLDGTRFEAFVDPPGGVPSTAPFYTTTDNQHPAPWTGTLAVPAGSFIRYRCAYQNVHDHDVLQGPSASEDEMCMFGGFYYPAMSAGDEQCLGQDEHGTGNASCADTTTCLAACPASDRPDFASGSVRVGPCWQRCIVDSCPNVTSALFPQLTCTASQCAAACQNGNDPACAACVSTSCKAESDRCQALPCGP